MLRSLPFLGISVVDPPSQIVHAMPADQPLGAHQVASRLFPAYTIDGGNVHLAGCSLDDRLFVRIEFADGEQSLQMYVDSDGREVEPAMIESLGMDKLDKLEKPPQEFKAEVTRLLLAGGRRAAERLPAVIVPEPTAMTAIWCKYAEGKLRFTIGPATADLPFSGWARTIEPPPFVCPATGEETYHLAASDAGRIGAAEKIEVCEETGSRRLPDELATCAATGKRVVPELLQECPISGDLVLNGELAPCRVCGEKVSRATLRRNVCEACRNLRRVNKADPRMALLLDEHPALDGWHNWRISETATVYVLTAGRLKRLLVVLDKESLELKRLATASRFLPRWKVVEPSLHDFAVKAS